MLQAALRRGLPVSSRDALLLREAALPTGVPDLIAVEPQLRRRSGTLKRRRLQLLHLQMLQFLAESGARTTGEIERFLNYSPKKITAALKVLETAGIVLREQNRFVSRSVSKVFVIKRIVVIEAKVRAWRDALEQAVANLWFASHSYILIPALHCLKAVREEAKKLGVGVLVFDGKQTRTVLRPRKQRIPSSYGSWLINEWAVQRLGL
jgi:DNA-binding MarR family transcriptional regulator